MMKILMFSQDSQALTEGSDTYARMRDYAEALGELHVIVRAAHGGRTPVSGGLFLYPTDSRGIAGFMRALYTGTALCWKYRFDVISAQGPDPLGLVGFWLAKRFHIPFQLQLHTDYMSPWYRRGPWKERVLHHLAKFLIVRADCVRAVSQRIRHSLLPIYFRSGLEQKTAVLPIYTDVSRFLEAEPDPETEQRFAGYDFKMIAAGRFVDKEKNFSMLIEMMRLFVRICPQALMVIVGEGPDAENYQSQIANHKLEKNVILEPWRRDLPSFLKSFDLFLLSSNYEGWGRVVIEAMAAGLPVVMTDVGLAGEVVRDGENGIVVPVGDMAAMLRAVRACYESAEKRKMLARTGREAVKNLQPAAWQEYLDRYRVCLASCMHSTQAS